MKASTISIGLLTAAALLSADRPKIPAGVEHILWTDPGAVERLDFRGGPGGVNHGPKAPFTFLDEGHGGVNPKIQVQDANARKWMVKWGEEVGPEIFASRLVWATGYNAEAEYFVPSGTVEKLGDIYRAGRHLDKNGRFEKARFELMDSTGKFLDDYHWTWKENPFVGTREFNGLKILTMLLANFDAKDGGDLSLGTNIEIIEKMDGGRRRWLYLVSDWGASLGKWGTTLGGSRSKWDCKGYASQTPEFIKGNNGVIEFGYKARHSSTIASGIRVEDVQWLMKYLGRVTDAQIRTGLEVAGGTPEEVNCFSSAIRDRINTLRLDQPRSAATSGR